MFEVDDFPNFPFGGICRLIVLKAGSWKNFIAGDSVDEPWLSNSQFFGCTKLTLGDQMIHIHSG